MMVTIESLGLSASQWQFLSKPERYVEASKCSGRPLVLESTRRQFLTARDILARLNGSSGEKPRRGILLADDVGLGKTTVAALVAWVVASAGGKRVRILAPNNVMMRRWDEELRSHVDLLVECAPALNVSEKWVKARKVDRLSPGSIQVVKHSYAASKLNLKCDLLIVDEAHRAKGEKSAFSNALKRQKKHACRILILTATPFSIHLDELLRMLTLIGGEAASAPVRKYRNALDNLYKGGASRSCEEAANRLAARAKEAVNALSAFVIRHGIDDLKREQASFGDRADWPMEVPSAKLEELELMLRMDRALRVEKGDCDESLKATNDPRFHVGWRHFDLERKRLSRDAPRLPEPTKAIVEYHLNSIKQLRDKVGSHSKMEAVGQAVISTIEKGEKVILFCHHHATAQELTVHVASVVQNIIASNLPQVDVWENAWNQVLDDASQNHGHEKLREAFILWLCSDLIRAQTWNWFDGSASEANLQALMKRTKSRHSASRETIAEAANHLFNALLQSKSSRAVLREAEDRPDLLPGANGSARVLGVCEPSDNEDEAPLFLHNQQPDTVISIFNSPFGPDVLVVTDKLSEGIDLHRYCRHLIHYELDPSPIRTVQRNGRLRRVSSWAAVTRQPILFAYPAFRGTRDQRLVQIMKKRIGSFSLLLGGVQDFNVEEVTDSDEKWRNDVIALAKNSLKQTGGQLCAKEPGGK